MKVVICLFSVYFILIFLFGKFNCNGFEIELNPLQRFKWSFVVGLILTLISILPVCGIMYLLNKQEDSPNV